MTQARSSVRVVFMGNHTVGVRVLEVLAEMAEVAGVVAHPPDPEDGVRYASVHDYATRQGFSVIRATGRASELAEFIADKHPDLLWITDYRYLVPPSILSCARLGAVNLHPSLLPTYRGRASINWAILNGETTLGLTGHLVDATMDGGDIIEQVSYQIGDDQDVGDCLEILYPLYASMTRKIVSHFLSGNVPKLRQDQTRATAFPARRPQDGVIDWNQSGRSILNLIRAVAKPYPGAFTTLHGRKLIVWKARIVSETGTGAAPGCVLEADHAQILVQCGAGVLALLCVEVQDPNERITVGCRLNT